jgi:uncharacterized protein (DUF488 family)
MNRGEILTLGHSTRSWEEFCALLSENRIQRVIDVRRFPGSRRFPHFGAAHLERQLRARGIEYVPLPELGGRRHTRQSADQSYWRSAGFRAYAEYMQSEEFGRALGELIRLSSEKRSVILCAEAVPWRCHRNLIADALVTQGMGVIHILGPGKTNAHELNPHARVTPEGAVIYLA